MTKIEERADKFSAKWLRQDQVQISYDGYMQGAKDQFEIDKKNYRERYKKIANSEWFKQDYLDKIIEEVIMED